jgi:hypothetical protein
MTFAFALCTAGILLISSGWTKRSLAQVINQDQAAASPTSNPAATSDTVSGTTPPSDLVTGTAATPGQSQKQAPVSDPVNPSTFAQKIATHPNLDKLSLSQLLAMGYTRNANGQVVSTRPEWTK